MSLAGNSFPIVRNAQDGLIAPGSVAAGWDSVDRGLARLRFAIEQAHVELRSLRIAYDQAVQVSRIALLPDMPANSSQSLTIREREVAALLASGRTNGEIAVARHVSVHTVNTQVKSILRKLGVRSRWQVAETVQP